MNKLFLFILLYILQSNVCYSQPASAKELNGTKWKCIKGAVHEKGDVYNIEYSLSSVHIESKDRYCHIAHNKPYYTTNTIPKSYSVNNVGKNTSIRGKYIVELYEKAKYFVVYEIEKFSTDTLKLRVIDVNNDFIGPSKEDLHLVFVRAK